MNPNRTRSPLSPDAWDISTDAHGQLLSGGCRLTDLAKAYGTPLHVLDEHGLEAGAWEFMRAVHREFGKNASVHYAMKCNSVPEVVWILRSAGLSLEVMTTFEMELALKLGCPGGDIIVNGPCKTRPFLQQCLDVDVKLIIVDSLEELHDINVIAAQRCGKTSILLRVNPNCTPRGVNRGSATSSRSGSPFGLDLLGGEVEQALDICRKSPALQFQGFHFHLGTGIRDPRDYRRALSCLPKLMRLAHEAQLSVEYLDVGGGFAPTTTREMTSRELLLYQAFGKLPSLAAQRSAATVEEYLSEIHRGIREQCPCHSIPHVILEPGRIITSPRQMLLLTVHHIKDRPGIGKWLITDGGLGTVTLPTFYECHEVLLCNDAGRPRNERVTITGPACFTGDIVYRNKWMPDVHCGEVLAIMDSGAYFTALESSFGFPRAAIVGVKNDHSHLIRKRDTFEDMVSRETLFDTTQELEYEHGICNRTN